MSMLDILFYLFGAVTAGGAIALVLVRNILHAALALLATLLGVAAIYVLLMADLLAVVQLMVYVGGVLVLIIFGVMLSTRTTDGALNVEQHNRFWGLGLFIVIVAGLIFQVIMAQPHLNDITTADAINLKSTVQPAGITLLTTFVLPFELVSVLLLVALVGAAYIAGKPAKDTRGPLVEPGEEVIE